MKFGYITSPDKFATWFNSTVPGAYRQITTQDVREITECGLIGCYNYYSRIDLETVRGILQYEQLRERRAQSHPIGTMIEVKHCKICRRDLPPQPDGKPGRPRNYCGWCESLRRRERSRKCRMRKRLQQKTVTEIEVIHNR